MSVVLTVGLTFIGTFAVLDTLVRLRLKGAGEEAVFFRGGTLDYSKYLRLRRKYQWSGWPVYLMPVLLLAGVALVVVALFLG